MNTDPVCESPSVYKDLNTDVLRVLLLLCDVIPETEYEWILLIEVFIQLLNVCFLVIYILTTRLLY